MKNKMLILSVLFLLVFAAIGVACYGTFNPPVISLSVPATAANGSQIMLSAQATDDHGVNYISLFDGNGNWLTGYFCGNTTTCSLSFLVAAPSGVGVGYSYKVFAYDIDGYSAEASGSGVTIPVIVPPVVPPTPPNPVPSPKETEAELLVTTFVIENADFIKDGDTIRFFYSVKNAGDKSLRDIVFSASIPELGIKAPSLRTQQLSAGKSVSRSNYIELPANVKPGIYYLQLSISSKDARRVVYREFRVN